MPGLVIDALHEGIFNAYAAFRSHIIIVGSIKDLRRIETFIHGHKFVTELITRRMEGNSQTYGYMLIHKLFNAGDDPHCRYRDIAC